MAKRVLGNDPFAKDDADGSTPAGEASKSAKPKASVRPKATPSRRPPAPRAKRTSTAPRAELPTESVVESAVPPADDDRIDAFEAAAPVDLPPDLQREPPLESLAPASRVAPSGEVKDEIRDLEAELDRLLGQVQERGGGRETLDRVAQRLRARLGETSSDDATPNVPALRDDQSVFDVARELLSSDYYMRQWGRVAMRDRSEDFDDFGLDPKFEARARPFFDFLYERWWRVETHDIERVPATGRVILCSNHSGALPYDGAMLATALRREHSTRRELRWLAEDFVFHAPFLGVFMNRIGAVRACQENAERLLRHAACVGVFPEGVKGISKLFGERYRLQRFGRGGHVKLAIRTRTTIVPVAIVGAEEAHPLIAPTRVLAKMLNMPFVPITPTFPWLGPLGLVPLPSKWRIHFLEPISMDGYAPESADDDVLVGRLNERIRGIIQDELDRTLRERKSVFRG